MHTCICNIIAVNEFADLVCHDVILVAIIILSSFLCPSGIYVFMTFFVLVVIPKLISFAIFYLGVFLSCVALLGGDYKAGIYQFTFVVN